MATYEPTWVSCSYIIVDHVVVNKFGCSGAGSPPNATYTVNCHGINRGFGIGCDYYWASPLVPPGSGAETQHARNCSIDCGNSYSTEPVGSNADQLVCECPQCPTGFDYDPYSERCVPEDCGDLCWCELSGTCVYCDNHAPPCREVLNCLWNPDTCEWDCDTPTCAVGQHWNWPACQCVPDCPTGQQWCIPSHACVSAPDPECAEALNCVWDALACEWLCDEPPCEDWNWETCACGSFKSPWCMHTLPGWYHVAYAQDDGAIRYRRSSRVYGPPWTVDVAATTPGEDETDLAPRMVMDRLRRIRLVFTRGGDTLLTLSDDDGLTWSDPPVELFVGGARATLNVHPYSRRILYGALQVDAEDDSVGVLVGRMQGPGENTPGAEFTMQLWDEVTEALVDLEVDIDTFHFSPAPEGSDRWMLVCSKDGGISNFYSADDGRTWRAVPEPA